jgi:hypothetical protein
LALALFNEFFLACFCAEENPVSATIRLSDLSDYHQGAFGMIHTR